jgi:hypothetical protein
VNLFKVAKREFLSHPVPLLAGIIAIVLAAGVAGAVSIIRSETVGVTPSVIVTATDQHTKILHTTAINPQPPAAPEIVISHANGSSSTVAVPQISAFEPTSQAPSSEPSGNPAPSLIGSSTSKSAESPTELQQPIEPQLSESQPAESQPLEPQSQLPESHSSESQTLEPQTLMSHSSESQTSESQLPPRTINPPPVHVTTTKTIKPQPVQTTPSVTHQPIPVSPLPTASLPSASVPQPTPAEPSLTVQATVTPSLQISSTVSP